MPWHKNKFLRDLQEEDEGFVRIKLPPGDIGLTFNGATVAAVASGSIAEGKVVAVRQRNTGAAVLHERRRAIPPRSRRS